MKTLIVVLLAAATAVAAVPLGCIGSTNLGTFQLSVRPFSRGTALPLKSVGEVPAGSRLVWSPVHLTERASGSAEVTAVVVPASDRDIVVLDPRKAAARTEWQLLESPKVVAFVFGPHGLSEGKIKSLVTHNRDLVRQLADYAVESSQVETLVQQLADAEETGGDADAVLKGFSSQYGSSPQKLDAASGQQTALLLRTLLPASNAYDPLASGSAQVQQTGGLAASVAGLFFGNPVGLAAGGATLFQNLKTTLFPNTEFRSAFTQAADKNDMAFCAKSAAAKAKTRIAYLWAYRVPGYKKPAVALAGAAHEPLAAKLTLELKLDAGSAAGTLEPARDWRLTPAAGGKAVPVEAKLSAAHALEIDLAKAKLAAGDYRLAATWDWDPLPVAGTLHIDPYGDFTRVTLAPAEHDKLIEGNGKVAVKLTGTDFEFLEKAAIESTARDAKPDAVEFTLPSGKGAGPQNSVTVYLDTAKRGSYNLLLTQSDGVAHKIPLTVLPPNPRIANLPIHLNAGETKEAICLEGSGMDRIDAVTSEAGEIAGAPDARGWSGTIRLKAGLREGSTFALALKVKGLDRPVAVPDAIEIVGPRPRILSVLKSLAGAFGIEVGADELPVGTPLGLALAVSHVPDSAGLRLELGCESGESRRRLTLSPGASTDGASLAFAGPGALYLSVDPGSVGYTGCRLAATVVLDPEGPSDPFVFGRVLRIPRLDRFTLTTEKVGDSGYAGILEGSDLDVIDKVGWTAASGLPVESIPAPVPGEASRQTLRVVLPWPAPAPHAPLYVWLRGEAKARKTSVAY